jgi:hypothetical protein
MSKTEFDGNTQIQAVRSANRLTPRSMALRIKAEKGPIKSQYTRNFKVADRPNVTRVSVLSRVPPFAGASEKLQTALAQPSR